MQQKHAQRVSRGRKIFGVISIIIFISLCIGLSVFFSKIIFEKVKTPEEFIDYIDSFGWKGRFVFLGLQMLQVLVALIPGEVIEIGAGYAFGAVEGTILCLIGVSLASSFVFFLTKKWGVRLVEIFVDQSKIQDLKFINNAAKLKRTIFLLFFIPGTPKDLITYFVGLTPIKLHEFLVISLIARIPSLISSTIGGHIIYSQNYIGAILLFLITGIISLIGMKIYSFIINKKKENDPDGEQSSEI